MAADGEVNLADAHKTLRRIEHLLEALVKAQLREVLEKELADKKHCLLYDQTGKQTVRQLSTRTGFSTSKISRIWQRWEMAGLLVKDGKKYKKLF